KEGVDLVGQLAKQASGNGASRSSYWGEIVTKSLPRAAVGPVVDQLKPRFVKHFAAAGGASLIGKAMPFGIGAAIGGAGNHLLGRRVLTTSRRAFGIAPAVLPAELEPGENAEKIELRMLHGARSAGSAIVGAADALAKGVGRAGQKVGRIGRGTRRAEELDSSSTDTDS